MSPRWASIASCLRAPGSTQYHFNQSAPSGSHVSCLPLALTNWSPALTSQSLLAPSGGVSSGSRGRSQLCAACYSGVAICRRKANPPSLPLVSWLPCYLFSNGRRFDCLMLKNVSSVYPKGWKDGRRTRKGIPRSTPSRRNWGLQSSKYPRKANSAHFMRNLGGFKAQSLLFCSSHHVIAPGPYLTIWGGTPRQPIVSPAGGAPLRKSQQQGLVDEEITRLADFYHTVVAKTRSMQTETEDWLVGAYRQQTYSQIRDFAQFVQRLKHADGLVLARCEAIYDRVLVLSHR